MCLTFGHSRQSTRMPDPTEPFVPVRTYLQIVFISRLGICRFTFNRIDCPLLEDQQTFRRDAKDDAALPKIFLTLGPVAPVKTSPVAFASIGSPIVVPSAPGAELRRVI